MFWLVGIDVLRVYDKLLQEYFIQAKKKQKLCSTSFTLFMEILAKNFVKMFTLRIIINENLQRKKRRDMNQGKKCVK